MLDNTCVLGDSLSLTTSQTVTKSFHLYRTLYKGQVARF